MPVVDLRQRAQLPERSLPVGDARLRVSFAGPEQVLSTKLRHCVQSGDDVWGKRQRHGLARLLRVEEQPAVLDAIAPNRGGIADPQPGESEQQHHRLQTQAVARVVDALDGVALARLQEVPELLIGERQRGVRPHLGRFHGERGVGLDPPRLVTEAEERAEPFEFLVRREGTIGPRGTTRPELGSPSGQSVQLGDPSSDQGFLLRRRPALQLGLAASGVNAGRM